MANLLLHTCCGPCATYTLEHWRKEGLELSAFWFNPNIHPYLEHQRRFQALEQFLKGAGVPLFQGPGYEMVQFIRRLVGREGQRCGQCFHLRLGRVAEMAKEKGLDAFSTTLLISPYQDHELLKAAGEEVAREKGIRFLYADLRPHFSESRRLSKELGLYRQNYCGCIYSEYERFSGIRLTQIADSLKEEG
jgi:predicted adenine nucleotide alpha hydrolase (AANH) superfamily ATPase